MVAWNDGAMNNGGAMSGDEDVQVVRDDTSSRGLRRLHLLRARGQLDKDEAILKWVGEHGRVEATLEYEDEVGMKHLRVYWR